MAELSEFIAAQDKVWPQVIAELRAGRKTSHWIWYVFPQLAILGRSQMARHFGLTGVAEAAAYLSDPILRTRLEEVTGLLLATGDDPVQVLGQVDAMKVRSSMTLFAAVPGASPNFQRVLDQMYDGSACPTTMAAISGSED